MTRYCTMCGRVGIPTGSFYACVHCDKAHPLAPCCSEQRQMTFEGRGPGSVKYRQGAK